MKKILVSFCILMVCLFSVVGTFASYTTVKKSASFKVINTTSKGTATLSGRRDDSTDRLSNCTTSKTENGYVTVDFSNFDRTDQYSASVTATFYYKGKKKQSNYLEI